MEILTSDAGTNIYQIRTIKTNEFDRIVSTAASRPEILGTQYTIPAEKLSKTKKKDSKKKEGETARQKRVIGRNNRKARLV